MNSTMGRRTSFALLAPLALLAGCEKARLDREVDRLCALDGGVHVYETVTLAPENFGPDGEVFPQFRLSAMDRGRFGDEFTYAFSEANLVKGNPSLVRYEDVITRKNDGKLLGKRVSYVRHGGDLPGPHEPSHKGCNSSVFLGPLENAVFTKGVTK